jgi:hypothetical protein
MFNRAKNLLITPQSEWVRVDAESNTRKQIAKSYLLPFIILIAICSIIGDSLFSLQPYSFTIILVKVVIQSLLLIGGVYLSAIIINELTTSFSISKDMEATFKLVTYSFTSFFIASCLVGLLPDMPVLALLGLHSIYLFWLGTTPVLKTPETSKVGFVVVSFLIIIGIYAILSLIIATIVAGMLYVSQPI